MKKSIIVSLILGMLMVSSFAVTKAMTPTVKNADLRDKINLEIIIPSAFGGWQIDKSIVPLQVDPRTQANLDKIYNQTLARTYVNPHGRRVMLSVAYGGDQSDSLSAHKPEVCYLEQGFEVMKIVAGELFTQYGTLPVKRMLAVQGNRNEPITYWITIGDKAVLPGLEQKLQQLRYGLTGSVPDGMLVRVSSIGPDNDEAYELQAQFVQDMLSAISMKERTRLTGTFGA